MVTQAPQCNHDNDVQLSPQIYFLSKLYTDSFTTPFHLEKKGENRV